MPTTAEKPTSRLAPDQRAWLKTLGILGNGGAGDGAAGDAAQAIGATSARAVALGIDPGLSSERGPSASPAAASESISVAGKATVKKGSKGQDVKDAQTLLNKHGASLKVDGDFGSLTDAAVREFQKNNPPLAVDGVVGPKTWAALAASPPDAKPRRVVFIVTSEGNNNAVQGAVCRLGDLSETTGDTGQATLSVAPGTYPFGV